MIDAFCVIAAAAGGIAVFFLRADFAPPMSTVGNVIDIGGGLLSSALLWFRRARPVGIALALLPAAALAASAAPAMAIVLFTVAARRSLPVAVAVALLQLLAATPAILTEAATVGAGLRTLPMIAALSAVLVAWGQLTRARKELLESLRQRAERAEAEQHLRTDHARQAERARIAREMHDVLAHRVSLIALHAGVLEVAPTSPPDTIENTAKLIRNTAGQAMDELRDVIGVLRDDHANSASPHMPQPDLAMIERLVDDWRTTGSKVDLDVDIESALLGSAPAGLGRDAYRIVQEALTNVSKHAYGAATAVRLSGGPDYGLHIEIRNRVPLGSQPIPSSSGLGLVGLTERATVAGGSLRHGVDARSDFVVAAHLPWPA